jgi:hypothetical protein
MSAILAISCGAGALTGGLVFPDHLSPFLIRGISAHLRLDFDFGSLSLCDLCVLCGSGFSDPGDHVAIPGDVGDQARVARHPLPVHPRKIRT